MPASLDDRVMKAVAILAGVLLLIAVGVVWLVIRQQGLADKTACQVRWNSAFAAAQAKRAGLSDADRAATQTLINQVFVSPSPGESRAQQNARILADYRQYKTAETAVTAGRAANKIPAVPDC